MSDIHVLFPQAAAHRDPTLDIRSAQPLVPEATAPFPAALRPAQALRLGMRHALLSRRPMFGFMAMTALLPIMGLLVGRSWGLLLGVIVPIFAFMAAIDGEGKGERFWVGMGGPPAMRELGRIILDQVVIHALFGLSVLLATDGADQSALAACWLASAALYGFGGLTRSIASTTQGRMLSALGLSLSNLLVGILPYTLFHVSLLNILAIQIVLLATIGTVARLLLSGRWSAVSASRRKWSPAWLLAPLLFLANLPYALLVA